VVSQRATAEPAHRRSRSASALPVLTVLVLLLGTAACSDGKASAEPTLTVTPDPNPSVWTTKGSPSAARAASQALLRRSDLPPGYTSSPLDVPSVRAVRPPACRALWGPGLGLLDGATGLAATAFVGTDLSAVAHSVGVYTTPAAGVAAVERARQLGRACARTVVNGATFAVTSVDRPGADGAPGVTLVLRQTRGVGQTTVTVKGRMVSVLVIASRPPGPQTALVQQTALATTRRLSDAVATGA